MIVSLNWLTDYVNVDVSPDKLAERLSLSGLNHEGTERVGDDIAIDLEVTSNRPDCLGHIGVAREIAVLWDQKLKIPAPEPKESSPPVDDLVKVRIDCPDLCYRYTARVIRGIKMGPSPDWLANRLRSVGIAVINNVVDITNYVLMECGQPLHAFDFAKLAGGEIIVREAIRGEQFLAIDHKTYELEPGTCVIADAKTAVALGGVMGGADTEIADNTTDLLIEAAEFDPLSIRTTARNLVLHSPSSYRFERGVDPEGIDRASRRACEMILDLAGGELAEGVVDVGREIPQRKPVVLRLAQLERILGIEIPHNEVRRILTGLGCHEHTITGEGLIEEVADMVGIHVEIADSVAVTPPSWRRDLTREIDLVEEVGRIYGYDKVPEDVSVPMVPSHRSDQDRVLAKVRHVLTSAGFDEAVTASVVSEDASTAFSPWTDAEPIRTNTPMLRGADRLRRSLVPSLLLSRHTNEALANPVIELFETAKTYLPGAGKMPSEQWMVGVTSGGDFHYLKGAIEALIAALDPGARLEAVDTQQELLDAVKSCELKINGRTCGYLGEVNPAVLKRFGLRTPATVAELRLSVLEDCAQLIPQHTDQSPFPAIVHDLNLIVDEPVRWSRIAATVRSAAGDCLENVDYQETYRDTQKDGAGKKRLLLTVTLRSAERTLTSEEAEGIRDNVVRACNKHHGAVLLG